MNVKRLYILAFAPLVLFGLGTCAYLQPIMLADKIQAAAERSDTSQLNDMIDFSSVELDIRNGLRDSYVAAVPSEYANDPQVDELFDILAHSAAREFATPTTVIQLLTDRSVYTKGFGDTTDLRGVFISSQGKEPDYTRRQGYETPNRYVYRFVKTSDPDTRFDIVAERKLLGWQVRHIRISIALK